MKSSKLIKILSSLSEKEFKNFEKSAFNHFHKTDKNISFLKFLSKNYPKFKEENITKEIVFHIIYKNESFADIRIRELMSATFKYLQFFLVTIENNSSDFYYQLSLLKQYYKRRLDSLYLAQLKVVKKILKKDNFKNKEYFRRKYLLASLENDYFNHKRIRSFDENIQVMLNNFDFYYFSTKLIESCEMLNRQKLLNQTYNLNLFKEIEEIIENNVGDYLNQPMILCYFEIFKLLKTNDDIEQYKRTVKILKKHTSFITPNELKSLFDFPKNYCIGNINKGNENYIEVLFELQQYLIYKEFNQTNGFISNSDYNNIITIALKLKKFEWSKVFIEKYKNKVTLKHRENAYNINKAYLYYSLKEYGNTLDLLNEIKFTDVYYAYYAKIIQLKTYFALKEYETLSYFIVSFKLYIKRNKEYPTEFKKAADLFLSYFKRILNAIEKKNFERKKKTTEKLNALSKKIKEEGKIHNRIWLLDIIE